MAWISHILGRGTLSRNQSALAFSHDKDRFNSAKSSFWLLLQGDIKASPSIEFALLAPLFIALLLAITNTTLIYLAQEGLESAADSAARQLLTGKAQTFQYYSGSTQNTGMTAAQFTNAICGTLSYNATANASTQTSYGGTMLPPFLDCRNLYVNVAPASSFTSANTAAPTLSVDANGNIVGNTFATTSSGNSQNQILVVQLAYLWPTVLGPIGLNMGNTASGNRLLVATEVIDTESYPCPTGTSQC